MDCYRTFLIIVIICGIGFLTGAMFKISHKYDNFEIVIQEKLEDINVALQDGINENSQEIMDLLDDIETNQNDIGKFLYKNQISINNNIEKTNKLIRKCCGY